MTLKPTSPSSKSFNFRSEVGLGSHGGVKASMLDTLWRLLRVVAAQGSFIVGTSERRAPPSHDVGAVAAAAGDLIYGGVTAPGRISVYVRVAEEV